MWSLSKRLFDCCKLEFWGASIILKYTRIIAQLIVLLCYSIVASSDYDSAIEEYKRNNYLAAFEQLLPLAQTGDARAQTIIAMMYKYGEGVQVDHAAAFEWYLSAANQDHAPAQLSVAEMYSLGKGTEPDRLQAVTWARRAAEQGLERAMTLYHELSAEEDNLVLTEPAQQSPLSRPRKLNLKLPDNSTMQEIAEENPAIEERYRVQLGAMKSQASANQLWLMIHQPNEDLFQGLSPIFKPGRNSRGGLIRLQVGPFASVEDANMFCTQLVTRGVNSGCLAVESLQISEFE